MPSFQLIEVLTCPKPAPAEEDYEAASDAGSNDTVDGSSLSTHSSEDWESLESGSRSGSEGEAEEDGNLTIVGEESSEHYTVEGEEF